MFHNLGPAFAVLLFARLDVLGVAWLRIAAAALVFAVWARPWRVFAASSWPQRRLLVALGVVLGLMNSSFYLALERLPLATVSAVEFLGPVLLAAVGVRTRRNLLAFLTAFGGVALLADARLVDEPLGFVFAGLNCVLFLLYVVLGHRVAAAGGTTGIHRLAAAMLVAVVLVSPFGFDQVAAGLDEPVLLAAGLGVGVCSSVIPYVCDQLAMARLSRATFALMLTLLPATATVVGVVVLAQVPTALEALGVALVVAGVAVHRQERRPRPMSRSGGAHGSYSHDRGQCCTP
ncbi:EamA family transporter [Micromonospora sp. WMMD1102]|uniref:EamA family transporter n=1 Tax=Micromonospora sp. WMMD1102 TaxID=3016105 RepID=UPI002414FA26|nr:EamA family transporter [Micromonospora sp. WMMD1102]MDG4788621.1 EamA family transporter [Micromonospora sp. WMMD1102]